MRDRGKTLEMYGGEESGLCCRKHPTQASGGICALCLKDKLSKLVCSDCGEQRPPSCSCSEAASSSSNNASSKDIAKAAGTVDVGSAGRISFLIESENVVDLRTGVVGGQIQCDAKSKPAKPDAIVLLKRSKSVACTTTTPPQTTSPLVARTPPPPQSSLLTAALAGDSKACASDNTTKRSSFWSFLYFIKSKPTSTKNNRNNKNEKSDQPKHELLGSRRPADQGLGSSRPSKEELAYKQQEVLCSRPTKKRVANRKAREAGLMDFADEISPRTATLGVVSKRPTEHRSEQDITSVNPVYESPLWMLPRLFRSRSVGCGRNSFSVDRDDISESGLKTEAKGNMSAYVDDKKAVKVKSKQAKSRSPKSVIVAAASADHLKIDKEEQQAKPKRQLSVKPKSLFGGFGKNGASFYGVSSIVSDDGNQTSGAGAGRSRGWGWAFSSPARIFKHKKPSRETISINNNGFMNQDTNTLSTSNSADNGLKGD